MALVQIETMDYVSMTIRMIEQQEEIDDLKKQLNAALEHNALLEKALRDNREEMKMWA
ncbi:hypothetical protein H8711_09950 [Clostridiaceae bacterium NSJ-31]|uniref:Uncharacterized protein n=1 Tax=Ligaoa zhengdingensis TaxID=2763658 RepID=A0A926DYM9_9FIRM|nr:hypothetical protein [Ligaoa zhengdingensis]MBC8547246.1 hypothetical protein [Ligaoa zhengdingensis]